MLLQLRLECVRGLSGLRLAHCYLGQLLRLTHRLAPRGFTLIRGFYEPDIFLCEINRVIDTARAAELDSQAQAFQTQF